MEEAKVWSANGAYKGRFPIDDRDPDTKTVWFIGSSPEIETGDLVKIVPMSPASIVRTVFSQLDSRGVDYANSKWLVSEEFLAAWNNSSSPLESKSGSPTMGGIPFVEYTGLQYCSAVLVGDDGQAITTIFLPI